VPLQARLLRLVCRPALRRLLLGLPRGHGGLQQRSHLHPVSPQLVDSSHPAMVPSPASACPKSTPTGASDSPTTAFLAQATLTSKDLPVVWTSKEPSIPLQGAASHVGSEPSITRPSRNAPCARSVATTAPREPPARTAGTASSKPPAAIARTASSAAEAAPPAASTLAPPAKTVTSGCSTTTTLEDAALPVIPTVKLAKDHYLTSVASFSPRCSG
jgi:hypothetical protein